ncbi:MAG: phosphoribosylamine--glycine ligase [Gammaproteobacteria bacterium]|jgi:phosphoribosylamine--glycine ligase|nr:phosphoribosylamine--glycine ligase [Gammaproteobacteria bacterium]MDP6534751.1 phosphoribosylamine--glycine ligase [Gammaproteobacteria bacterium]MDP6731842.1 phosphoribosylamine--glycine ligase [Gammaproteobacteria bacterium]
MKVLVIGSGGREHALAWKCAQSDSVEKVFVAPGNAGTAREEKLENIAIDVMDFATLADFADSNKIELTIVGPEAPLVGGIVDYFQERQLPCFGPSAGAAQLEGSKAFTKDFLYKHGIPTAAYKTFTDLDPALAYIRENGTPIVIKADGLAAGKGVIVAMTEEEAIETVESMLSGNKFGEAGHRVVIEEFLEGEEASFIAMVDGSNVLPMATSQDHKARDDGDKGPNTGGMGAYSPALVVTAEVYQRIMDQVILPTVRGMAEDGNDYTGFLYAGLMVSPSGAVAVVEFNCRFGDPEAQPVMLRLRSDLAEHCVAAINQNLDQQAADWDSRYAVSVVLASGGYPGTYNKGDVVDGLDTPQGDHQKVFHAGTAERDGAIVTNGGRVLCATALGDKVSEAQAAAYELVKSINWNNVYFRNDIAHRAIARENG